MVTLARGSWGKDRYPDDHATLTKVVGMVQSGSITVPLSFANIYETSKINVPHRRANMARAQSLISSGIVFRGRRRILTETLAAYLADRNVMTRPALADRWYPSCARTAIAFPRKPLRRPLHCAAALAVVARERQRASTTWDRNDVEECDDDEDLRVCHGCIGEDVLKAEILRDGRPGECAYCANEEEPSVTIAALARRVDDVFREVVGTAREEVSVIGGHVTFGPSGETPSFLMTEMTEAEQEGIGADIVSHLSDRHQWDVHDGDFDYYDDTSDIYAITDASDGQLRERWTQFCVQLKQERRFFLNDGITVLDEILAPLLEDRWPDGGAIRTIGPEDADRFIYRGRLANDDGASAAILRQRISQLGAARPGKAESGRMNPAGVSVFYGAFDPITCVAELRVPVGGSAIVGRFEVLRPLRVLDLTRLEAAQRRISYFEPGYAELKGYAGFVRGFHEEVKRAVIPGRETVDYLPTQIVAEYLWARADPPFDGLIFGSSQLTHTQNNIALFPHASIVEGTEDDAERRIHFSYTYADEDQENLEERIMFEPLPAPAQGAAQPAPAAPEDDWFSSLMSDDEPAVVQPALRLTEDGVARHRVRAISFETDPAVPISFSDWEDHGF